MSREEGARIAAEELSDPAYGNAEPGWIQRVFTALGDLLQEFLRGASGSLPGGWWTLGPLLAVLVLVVIALIVYARPSRNARTAQALFGDSAPATPADHRAAAERHAAGGDYSAAVRERLRAVALELEERGVVAPRPGRTATELAADAGEAMPAQKDALEAAAAVFNDCAYGDRPATPDGYRTLRELDEALSAARPREDAR
ncbi:DUF4129 domain-containing protein [Nocardiopsis sp. RSe5-2]|uniref:DUF4129 domain-containing protein n=1 Tax=Nocardiopsis endophytica TaxID=3018445 RepID=A0ABT4TZV8_9ACTN|nr:DUF4129 domain-containing protein [Nocardiopsis endophytica]MDA2810239.1 DUF4129 domain-containing protein [Nocardiopsis endophytica]